MSKTTIFTCNNVEIDLSEADKVRNILQQAMFVENPVSDSLFNALSVASPTEENPERKYRDFYPQAVAENGALTDVYVMQIDDDIATLTRAQLANRLLIASNRDDYKTTITRAPKAKTDKPSTKVAKIVTV
jgi:hypothetical protein